MFRKTVYAAALAVAGLATPAIAHHGVSILDPYARVATPNAASGAAFMQIRNHEDSDDRLIGVESDVAQRVELHTHEEDADGIMRMMEVEDGFVIPADGWHTLGRGGDHVMFMGLTRSLAHGDRVDITLIFENAGKVQVTLPVDLEREADHEDMSGHHDHGGDDGHSHGDGAQHD